MTVYVVIEYWQSEPFVSSIWSTRELAEAFIEKETTKYKGNFGILEYIIDKTILKLG